MNRSAVTGDLPAWVRVGCAAWATAEPSGHARFGVGQLRRILGLSPQQLTDAIAVARSRGWVDQASTARCIVLPGCSLNPCEERHR